MLFAKQKLYVQEKSCLRCYAYIKVSSRKCKFCGYVYKSSGRYIVDKLLNALRINRDLSAAVPPFAENIKTDTIIEDNHKFFTPAEIENLAAFEDTRILMFMNLDDLALLDETALIQLGETIIGLNNS